jgi:parallel beta-helix repeat protein
MTPLCSVFRTLGLTFLVLVFAGCREGENPRGPEPPDAAAAGEGEPQAGLLYVAADGRGQLDGVRPEKIYQSIAEAVSAAEPGDTVVVAPGVYHEAVILPPGGDINRPITIRAEFPGWTEMRGSVTVTGWEPVAEYPHVYRAPLEKVARLVVEAGAGKFYREAAGPAMVAEYPGSFFYDPEAKQLLVQPSGDRPIGDCVIEASVLPAALAGREPEPFGARHPIYAGWIIEGLVVWGYYDSGIYIPNADGCEVRDCTAYFCGRGIFFQNAAGSAIRRCRAFSCHTPFNREMGGIAIRGYFAACLLEDNVVHDTPDNGIRFYGAHYGVTMRGNLVHDCRVGLQLKGEPYTRRQLERHLGDFASFRDLPDDLDNLLEGNVAHRPTGGEAALIAHKSVFRRNTAIPVHSAVARGKEDNLELPPEAVGDARFADPEYHDLRLQADSPWRKEDGGAVGSLPYDNSVRFVGPQGDDAAGGDSVAAAWRSLPHALGRLQPGQTLYLLPGVYPAPLDLRGLRAEPDQPTRVRAHGRGRVVIDGEGQAAVGLLVDDCRHLTIEGLSVRGTTEAGVLIRGSAQVLLEENAVFGNAGNGIALAGGNEDISLLTNVVTANEGAGLQIGADTPRLHLSGLTVRGNGVQLSFPGGQPSLWRSDRNNLGAPVARDGTTLHASLGNWRQAGGQDANSGDFDPGFVDAATGDFSLRPHSLSLGRGHLHGAAGTSRVRPDAGRDLSFEGVAVLDVRPDAADLIWETPVRETTRLVAYGTDPENLDRLLVQDLSFHFGHRHAVTLGDLEPGRRYYFRVGDRRLVGTYQPFHSYRYVWPERGPDITKRQYEAVPKEDTFSSRLHNFETPAAAGVDGRVFHVSTDGDDAAAGSAGKPWRTIARACSEARAGDRVVIGAGVYHETIRPLRSGTTDAPIVFEAEPGQRVEINGAREVLPAAVELVGKRNIVIRGLVFHGQREMGFHHADNGQVLVVDSRGILVEDCLFDGRMNYVTSLRIHRSADVTARNNIFVSHHHAVVMSDNSGFLDIDHNSFLGPTELAVYAVRNNRVRITNNIINECLYPKKKLQYRVRVLGNRHLEMDHNCYVFHPDNEERRAVDYGGPRLDLADTPGLPELDTSNRQVRIGIKGDLRRWQEDFGQDRHSVIVENDPGWVHPRVIASLRGRQRKWPDRDFSYPVFGREAVVLRPESVLHRAARHGRAMGASWPPEAAAGVSTAATSDRFEETE